MPLVFLYRLAFIYQEIKISLGARAMLHTVIFFFPSQAWQILGTRQLIDTHYGFIHPSHFPSPEENIASSIG